MIKVGEKYVLQTPDLGDGFNLMEEVERVTQKTGEKRKDLKLIGYNMTMDRALKKIAELECSQDDYSDIIGYMDAINDKVDAAAGEIKELLTNLK